MRHTSYSATWGAAGPREHRLLAAGGGERGGDRVGGDEGVGGLEGGGDELIEGHTRWGR
jgi:hypothetical protein